MEKSCVRIMKFAYMGCCVDDHKKIMLCVMEYYKEGDED